MIRIGKIVATHGVQGDLILSHVIGHSRWMKRDAILFLELNKGSFIPFFVKESKANTDNEYVVRLEDVATVEAGKRLIGKQVYLKEEEMVEHAASTPLAWIGFKLIDKQKGDIGNIHDMMQTPTQWLATLMVGDKEVLIPLIEQTIEKIDARKKTIYVNLPDGLMEIYL
jgi:16S rRNA processing protein RimM